MHNPNVTQASNFLFVMSNETKHIQFFVQEFSGLGISFNEVDNQTYMGQRIKRPGDLLTFNDITLTVIIDEDLDVLEEAYNFMAAGGLKDVVTNELNWNNLFTGFLHLSTNRNNFKKTIKFDNCWIRELGDLNFQSTQGEVSPMITSIIIAFDAYTIENVE